MYTKSLCIGSVFLASAAVAQLTLVLIANYDIKLDAGSGGYHITSQAKVRNGKTIPIEIGDHRIDVKIDTVGEGQYRATIDLFERSGSTWFKINSDSREFESLFGAPVTLQWRDADFTVDLAIAVSVSHE